MEGNNKTVAMQNVLQNVLPNVEGRFWICVSNTLPSIQECQDFVTLPSCGAISSFVGITRDVFKGKKVSHLSYEGYVPMAEKVLFKVCIEATIHFPSIGRIVAVHVLGDCPVGNASVIIYASSPHRADALGCVEFLINELKARVPIWKREVYEGSDSIWKENIEWHEGKKQRVMVQSNNGGTNHSRGGVGGFTEDEEEDGYDEMDEEDGMVLDSNTSAQSNGQPNQLNQQSDTEVANAKQDQQQQPFLGPYNSSKQMEAIIILPEDFLPCEYDVICGKGKRYFNHAGNQRFRARISAYLPEYEKAKSKMEKGILFSRIVDIIRNESGLGGFVAPPKDDGGRWHEVGDEAAREKVGQAFRDCMSAKIPHPGRKGVLANMRAVTNSVSTNTC